MIITFMVSMWYFLMAIFKLGEPLAMLVSANFVETVGPTCDAVTLAPTPPLISPLHIHTFKNLKCPGQCHTFCFLSL